MIRILQFINTAFRIIHYTLFNFSEVTKLASEGSLIKKVEKLDRMTILEITHYEYETPWYKEDTVE